MKMKIVAFACVMWSAPVLWASQTIGFEHKGRETLDVVQRDHAIPNRPGAYYEDHRQRAISFAWGKSMLLLAYGKAAQVDPDTYAERMDALICQVDRYWVELNGIGGYDHLPHPRSGGIERYYDDNAWVAMGQIDAYEATKKKAYLERAKKTIEFLLSGINQKDGGIWWQEDPKESMNTCSVAPTAFACLRYYEMTGQRAYLETAKALMVWLDATLQDEDMLYLDNITPSGRINRMKWTYNTGMPLQNYIKLYRFTGQERYLDKAKKIAQAAEKHWVDAETGAIKCESMFVWTLIEGWVELSAVTDDPHWQTLGERAATYLYAYVRDPNGRYPKRWDRPTRNELTRWMLLYPASNARAYWVLAAASGPISTGEID